jgi:hypothetical protein
MAEEHFNPDTHLIDGVHFKATPRQLGPLEG